MSHPEGNEIEKSQHLPAPPHRNHGTFIPKDATLDSTGSSAQRSAHLTRKWQNLTGKEYTIGPKIAGGGFSTVYKGILRREGCPFEPHPVAVKQMSEINVSKQQNDEFMAELYAMTKCAAHPNIVHLYGASIHSSRQAFLMELCHGSLQDRLESGPPSWIPRIFNSTNRNAAAWPLPFLIHWTSGAASALRHIHSLRVFHRDIKAANFLMRSPTSTVQNELQDIYKRADATAKVISANKRAQLDGLNTLDPSTDKSSCDDNNNPEQKGNFPNLCYPSLPERASLDKFGRPIFETQFGYLPCVENVVLSDFGLVGCESVSACTPTHAAPELLSGKGFGRAVDIWAFGVLLIEMFTLPGDPKPFANWRISDIITAVLHNRTKPSTRYLRFDTPSGIRQLINRCLAYNAQERPTADEICNQLHQLQYTSKDTSLSVYFAECHTPFVDREKRFNVVSVVMPEQREGKDEEAPPPPSSRPKSAITVSRFSDLNSRSSTAQLSHAKSSLYDYKLSEEHEENGKTSERGDTYFHLAPRIASAQTYSPSYSIARGSKDEFSSSYRPSFQRSSIILRISKETEETDSQNADSAPTPTPDLPDYLRPVTRESRPYANVSRPFTAPNERTYKPTFPR